ncbi:MAG TPA: hypothetical protein DFS52_03960 [Myxococcales bacterium]|nr:hypothetical protein [Myxococcales bacterium]
MGCGKREFARLLEGSFLGELSLSDWERLRAHLAACEGCRAEYDRQVLLQRAMRREPGPLPAESLERIGESVLARLGAVERGAKRSRRSWWWKAASVAAPAAALALLLVLVPREADRFQARSSGGAQVEGVRAFCIEGEGAGARVRSTTDFGSSGELRCRRSDTLQLSYSSGPAGAWLAVVSVPEGGEGGLLEYTGQTGEGQGVRIEASRVDEPLPYSTRLQARHAEGARVVVALFCERALSAEELEAAARAVAAGGEPGAGVRVARVARLVVE